VAEDLQSIIDASLEALDEEIDAVRVELARRGLERPIQATGGRLVRSSGPGFRYEFKLPDDPLDIRPDDGVYVRIGGVEALGFVASFKRASSVLLVVVPEWLGRHADPAELEFDPTWLLTTLAQRLAAVAESPERYHPATMLALFGRSYPDLDTEPLRRLASSELNSTQRQALERILGSDVHFVWGPPGTGKTLLVGHAVAELAETGKVLVVATTNTAVDEAASRVVQALGPEAVRANRVVRVGAEFAATGDDALSLGAALERRISGGAGGVTTAIETLEAELLHGRRAPAGRDGQNGKRRPAGSGPAQRDIRARHARLLAAARAADDDQALGQLGRLSGELQKQSILALREADVVLTTLARLAVRDELMALRFDSLVLDEASTAPLPYVALAAALTARRAVAIGDFQQLPPVVVSRGEAAARWLSRDVFREAGVVADAPPGELAIPSAQDRLCAMLTEQYRMAPPIRSIVSEIFYDGRLTDTPSVLDRPAPRSPLVLIETEGLGPAVERAEGSRANAAHAEAIIGFLEAAASAGVDDVAVVVPYRLQSRRLWRLARGRLGQAAPRNLEISTIHRYQGREKSVVVFDTVDAPPGRSWFLHEGRNLDFPRLLNVALSRTRDMLVLVGTSEGLRQTLPPDSLLNRVVDRVREGGTVLPAENIGRDARGLF
jgi:hypothetical protein